MLKKIIPTVFLIIISIFVMSSCKDKHEHNYVETVFPSTCVENGHTQRLCTGCGDELLFDFKPKGNHTGDVWRIAKEPTCQLPGSEERICTSCNKVVDSRAIAKLGHTNGKWTVTKNPTCKDTGTEKLFCSSCGIDLETKMLSVTEEHNFASFVTLPTTTEDGYTTYTCKICDFTKKDDFVPKIEISDDPTDSTLTNGEIYDMVSNAMVRIDAYDKAGRRYSLGSGFFISNDGKIATNFHVINTAYSLKVTLYSDNSTYTVSNVLGYNKAEDVAIIQIEKQNTPCLELSTEPLKTGDTVYTLGSPMGVTDIFSVGIVSNPSVKISGMDCIAITAPISSGNSGGPLLNKNGQVVGINTLTIEEAQNLNFSVKATQITTLNTSTPITVSSLYSKMLADNAFDILSVNIMLHAQAVDGDEYTIYQKQGGDGNEIGFEFYYIMNSETSEITIRMYLLQNSKRLHYAELYINGVSEKYLLSFYDMKLDQTTIMGMVNSKNPAKNYDTDFNNLFDISVFRYNDSDTPPAENMRKTYFICYQAIMESLKAYLANSNTGLTMSHFNFNY